MLKNILYKSYPCLFLLLSFFSNGRAAEDSYLYRISVCAIFRDDARFLKEWIEFHRIIGAEHFWLYNNLSKDNYSEILSPYIEEGIVELIEWPFESEDVAQWVKVQNAAYDDSISRVKGASKWVIYIDTDEFLFPVNEERLFEILNEFEDFGGLVVNWQMYGTSWVKRVPDDRLMTEFLTRKAKPSYRRNRLFKSIVRPERVKKFTSAHSPNYFEGFERADINKETVTSKYLSKKIWIDRLRINHYWTRDEDFFIEVKANRRDKPDSDYEGYLKDYELLNEYEDTSIFKYLEMLRNKIQTARIE